MFVLIVILLFGRQRLREYLRWYELACGIEVCGLRFVDVPVYLAGTVESIQWMVPMFFLIVMNRLISVLNVNTL